MKKQTAVDFIIEKLAENGVLHSSDIWMAKSIEKAHIIDAHFAAQIEDIRFWNEAKQEALDYYNETFNKEV